MSIDSRDTIHEQKVIDQLRMIGTVLGVPRAFSGGFGTFEPSVQRAKGAAPRVSFSFSTVAPDIPVISLTVEGGLLGDVAQPRLVLDWMNSMNRMNRLGHLVITMDDSANGCVYSVRARHTLHIHGLRPRALHKAVSDVLHLHDRSMKHLQGILSAMDLLRKIEAADDVRRTSRSVHRFDGLVGVTPMKEHVRRMAALKKLAMMREAAGLAATDEPGHLVFTGPPGTGKTTSARLYAQALKDIGMLEKGHLVEVERSHLVGAYIGHSAIKTKEWCEKALDGVLFIDEAYSLCVDGRDFGDEVIQTLLTFMENNRDRIVVIVAGYGEEMERFIASNPGLRSRFEHVIDFPSYTVTELTGIFAGMVRSREFEITEAALAEVRRCIAALSPEARHGNARTVRSMVEEMIVEHALFLEGVKKPTKTQLSLLTVLSVPSHWERWGELGDDELPPVA